MFGLGLKKSTAEAISRGVKASLTGAYLHPKDIEKLGINRDAAAVLLTEIYAHHLFALWLIYIAACKNDKWANDAFFLEAAFKGMLEYEGQYSGVPATTLSSIVFSRFKEFQAYGTGYDAQIMSRSISTDLILKSDETADENVIHDVLYISTDNYSRDVARMF